MNYRLFLVTYLVKEEVSWLIMVSDMTHMSRPLYPFYYISKEIHLRSRIEDMSRDMCTAEYRICLNISR